MTKYSQDDLALLDSLGTEPLLLPREVGMIMRVDPKTVTRWSQAGRLPCIKTLGGHRRYRVSDVRALYAKLYGEPIQL